MACVHASSSTPTLGTPSWDAGHGDDDDPERARLAEENDALRAEIGKLKAAFAKRAAHEERSTDRRRVGPMRRLVSEQWGVASGLLAASTEKERVITTVSSQMSAEAGTVARRAADERQLNARVVQLRAQLEAAEAEAAEAWRGGESRAMMERRLMRLLDEDRAKGAKLQRVIDDCDARLAQWLAVGKEGESELKEAEGQLNGARARVARDRHQQRKLIGERRQVVSGMEKVKDDRSARVHSEHESVLASQGDLDAAGEAELKRAAGASSLVRAMHSVAVSKSFSHEEKCRDAFRQIEGLTGARDMQEVLFLLTSKQEMADQLQKRSETGDARLAELKTKRDALERERSNAQYGYASDPQATEKITQAQRALNEADEAAAESAARRQRAGDMLKQARVVWHNLSTSLDAMKLLPESSTRRRQRRREEGTTTRRSTPPMPSCWGSSTA